MLLVKVLLPFLLPASASRLDRSVPEASPSMSLPELLTLPVESYLDGSGQYRPVFNSFDGESCTFKQFTLTKAIAWSKTSAVFTAQYKGKPVIVKMYEKLRTYKVNDVVGVIRMEEVILHKLDHPNITKGICTFKDLDGSVYLAMEYTAQSTLEHKKYTEEAEQLKFQQKFAKQMVDALIYLHSMNIFHNDIKPENIIVAEDWTIKLIDFGLSVYRPKGCCRMMLGSPLYMAPEKLFGKSYNNGVDWYAFGMTLYELVNKKSPFEHLEVLDELKAIITKDIPKLKDPMVNDFVSKLCNVDMKLRWCSANGNEKNILDHEFLKDKPLEHTVSNSSNDLESGPVASLDHEFLKDEPLEHTTSDSRNDLESVPIASLENFSKDGN